MHVYENVWKGALILSVCFAVCGAEEGQAPAELNPKAAGRPEIGAGFIFIDGKYIHLPYRVSATDRIISINGIPIFEVVGLNDRPRLPTTMNAEGDLSQLKLATMSQRLDIAIVGWIKSHIAEERIAGEILDVYKGLPFVAKVEWVAGRQDSIRVTMKNGASEDINIGQIEPTFIPRGAPILSDEQLRQGVAKRADHYAARLKAGDCFFAFSNGFEIEISGRRVQKDIALIINTIAGKAPVPIKRKQLEKIGILPANVEADVFDKMLANFTQDSELERRVKSMAGDMR